MNKRLVGLAALVMVLASGCAVSSGSDSGSVAATGFSLRSNSLQVAAGSNGYTVVTATRGSACNGVISLTMRGLPAGVSATGEILAGAATGHLTVTVAPEVPAQVLAGLTLVGDAGGVGGACGFKLVVVPAPTASSFGSAGVSASGGRQSQGSLVNTGLAQEPVTAVPASSPSGAIQARSGFLPVTPAVQP